MSHLYVSLKASQFLKRPFNGLEIISCHLGLGASMCAMRNGVSQASSMGFSALDGLMMGTMQRTRSSRIKAMVVMGANEGILPAEPVTDSILNEDEKLLLLEKGMELCKVDQVRGMEEKLAIYRNLSKATDCLWIGYAASDQS